MQVRGTRGMEVARTSFDGIIESGVGDISPLGCSAAGKVYVKEMNRCHCKGARQGTKRDEAVKMGQ